MKYENKIIRNKGMEIGVNKGMQIGEEILIPIGNKTYDAFSKEDEE